LPNHMILELNEKGIFVNRKKQLYDYLVFLFYPKKLN